MQIVNGYAIQVWFLQDSLGAAQEMERKRCLETRYGLSGLVWLSKGSGKCKRSILDSSTGAARKGRGKR
jgi:hypothetical protein